MDWIAGIIFWNLRKLILKKLIFSQKYMKILQKISDHFGTYGIQYTYPNICKLAVEGVLFRIVVVGVAGIILGFEKIKQLVKNIRKLTSRQYTYISISKQQSRKNLCRQWKIWNLRKLILKKSIFGKKYMKIP